MSDQTSPPAATAAPSWIEALAPEHKAHVAAKGYKTADDVIKAHMSAEALIGTKRLPAPDESWKPDDKRWDDLYAQLGRPESPDKYKAPDFKLPDGMNLDDDLKVVRETAHRLGLSQRQAGALMETYMKTAADGHKAIADKKAAELAASTEAIHAKYGDQAQTKQAIVAALLKKHGAEGLADVLNQSGIGNNPALFETLLSIGQATLEDSALGGAHGLSVPEYVRAQEEIKNLQLDPTFMHAYVNGQHPSHSIAVDRMLSLRKKAQPPAS